MSWWLEIKFKLHMTVGRISNILSRWKETPCYVTVRRTVFVTSKLCASADAEPTLNTVTYM